MSDKDYAIKENIAAIAIQWGWHQAKYLKAMKLAATQSGSAEMLAFAIQAAERLEEVAAKGHITWGEDAEWPLTVDAYAVKILDYAIKHAELPGDRELAKIAEASIDWN